MNGAAHILWHEETISLLPSHMLWLQSARWLVAADLHIGKARHFARMGQFLPPQEVQTTLERISAEVKRLKPDALVLLGDTLHSGAGLADETFTHWCEGMAAMTSLRLIGGNHDPSGLAGAVPELTLAASGIRLRHAPDADPSPQIVGHLHPCITLATRAGKQRRRCFVVEAQKIVLPALGALTGSFNFGGSDSAKDRNARYFVAANGRVVAFG